MSHMKSSAVEVLQVINLNNIATEVAKPHMIGYMFEKGDDIDMIAEISEPDGLMMNPSIVMDEKNGQLHYAEPFCLTKMKNAKGNEFVPETQLHSTCVYIKLSFITFSISAFKSEIFR